MGNVQVKTDCSDSECPVEKDFEPEQLPSDLPGEVKGRYIAYICFFVTFVTTSIAGSYREGGVPFTKTADIVKGLPFSIAVMFILLSHELGHYYAAKRHKVKTSLPIFIPGPSLIGTFGAFIYLKSKIKDKKALFDIGASGPLVGFVASVVVMAVGLFFSEITQIIDVEVVKYGRPLLFDRMERLIVGVPEHGQYVKLHAIAFAGWIGMFLTSMNLLPIGQLDGGHILYAICEKQHKAVSIFLPTLLVCLGFLGWPGWYLWAFLTVFIGPVHPSVVDSETPLDKGRVMIGIISLVVFTITFIPVPFYF